MNLLETIEYEMKVQTAKIAMAHRHIERLEKARLIVEANPLVIEAFGLIKGLIQEEIEDMQSNAQGQQGEPKCDCERGADGE